MEDDLHVSLEELRRKVEILEDDFDNHEAWKILLNELNEIKVKSYAMGIFSNNEEFKDIKTEDIKFLLISFYQAEVIQKFSENRETILSHATQFYKEFYNILESYEYLTKERKDYYKKISGLKEIDGDDESKGKSTVDELSKEREEKILAYRYKKALSDKLKPEDLNNLDPMNKLMKNLSIVNTSTNPDCIDCNHPGHNFPLMDEMIHQKLNQRDYIFRSANMPTMTLDEFATKEKARMDEQKVLEEEAKKNAPNDDSDDEEVSDMKTYQARYWDDWKDLNEKGSGNKQK